MNRSTRGKQLVGSLEVLSAFFLAGTQVTASAAELNILDGVTASAAELNLLAGAGAQVASGSPASNIAAVSIGYSAGTPVITPDGAVTISDGGTPTVNELLELCVELNTKVTALSSALQTFGIIDAP